jgi:hypothetical protein
MQAAFGHLSENTPLERSADVRDNLLVKRNAIGSIRFTRLLWMWIRGETERNPATTPSTLPKKLWESRPIWPVQVNLLGINGKVGYIVKRWIENQRSNWSRTFTRVVLTFAHFYGISKDQMDEYLFVIWCHNLDFQCFDPKLRAGGAVRSWIEWNLVERSASRSSKDSQITIQTTQTRLSIHDWL